MMNSFSPAGQTSDMGPVCRLDWTHRSLPISSLPASPSICDPVATPANLGPILHVAWIPEQVEWAPHIAQPSRSGSCTASGGHPGQTALHCSRSGIVLHVAPAPSSPEPELHTVIVSAAYSTGATMAVVGAVCIPDKVLCVL